MRFGNFDSAVAKQTVLPQKRRELLDHAKYEFIEALAIWKQHGAQSILGIAQPNKITVLERKISRLPV